MEIDTYIFFIIVIDRQWKIINRLLNLDEESIKLIEFHEQSMYIIGIQNQIHTKHWFSKKLRHRHAHHWHTKCMSGIGLLPLTYNVYVRHQNFYHWHIKCTSGIACRPLTCKLYVRHRHLFHWHAKCMSGMHFFHGHTKCMSGIGFVPLIGIQIVCQASKNLP